MSDVTQILAAVERGEPSAADELLPLIYDELRRLAAQRLSREKPGQTLQATALVHEAWLRLAGKEPHGWRGRSHFFAAAAQAMRHILIDRARRKASALHGGHLQRVDLDSVEIIAPLPDDQLLALDEALEALAIEDRTAAELVKLRFFIGLTHEEAAELLGLNRTAADQLWVFARARLFQRMGGEEA